MYLSNFYFYILVLRSSQACGSRLAPMALSIRDCIIMGIWSWKDKCTVAALQQASFVLDTQTQNGDEPVGEYSFSGQSCLSSADSC